MGRLCRIAAVVSTSIVLLALGSVPAAARTCASADIDEPFVLPDGNLHPAGRLTLCFERENSPVSYLHRVYVDHEPIGIFGSRRELQEATDGDRYYLLFIRGGDRTLRLSGYSVPRHGGSELYALDTPRVEVRDSLRSSAAGGSAGVAIVRVAVAIARPGSVSPPG